MASSPSRQSNVRSDGGHVGRCTGCHDHYWNYWGRGTYCPACLAGYVDNLNEELGVSSEEIEQAAAKVGDLQGAIDRAHAALRGSEYVGGPTEREAWRTAYAALSEVVTQHVGQGAGQRAS